MKVSIHTQLIGVGIIIAVLYSFSAFAKQYWVAVCSDQHGLVRGWTSSKYDSREAAQQVADAHEKSYGHTTEVFDAM